MTQCLRFSKNFKIRENHQRCRCAWVGLADFAEFFLNKGNRIWCCARVSRKSQKSKDKNKKEREISPLHADVFPAYIKSRTGEICSSPAQISQYFTAFSCQLTILSSARRSRHAAILAIYKAPTSDP